MASNLKDQLNFNIDFKDWYFKIMNDFKFDYSKDVEARDLLSQIFTRKEKNWDLENVISSFKNLVQEKSCIIIYGCGPSLETTTLNLLKNNTRQFFNKCINLAANGSSILLKENEIPIDGIFTDLDGITKDEFKHAKFNIIHAHGDNIEKLKYFENDIIRFQNIIGTTQVEPSENILNPGGFTDGDRILFFLRTLLLPEQKIFFIGMDFQDIVGKYSKLKINKHQKANPIKKKKLKYALQLIEWIQDKIQNEFFFINSLFASKKFNYLTLEQFEKMIKQ